MKIKMLQMGGRSIPQVFCDICDKQITDGKDGWCLTPVSLDGSGRVQSGDLIIGHTSCTNRYEKEHRSEDITFYSTQLDVLMAYLFDNLKIDHDEANEKAIVLGQL